MSERENVLNALFALGRVITWPSTVEVGVFRDTGRRVKHFTDCPAQPAFYQYEPTEMFVQPTRMPSKRTLDVMWVVYHQVGQNSGATPTTETNLILDAIEAALKPDDFDDRCTLGGLAHHVWIEGQLFKDSGDMDGQAVLSIPIKILLP